MLSCRALRRTTCDATLVDFTHADSVIAPVMSSVAESLATTRLVLVSTNCNADPACPATHAGLLTSVPPLSWPDPSAAIAPLPSSSAYHAIKFGSTAANNVRDSSDSINGRDMCPSFTADMASAIIALDRTNSSAGHRYGRQVAT